VRHTEYVPDFCTCGAQLPPDARFCHKCGKPQYDYPGLDEPAEEVAAQPPPLPAQAAPSNEINFHNRTAVRISFIVAVLAIVAVLIPGPTLFQILRFFAVFFFAGAAATIWYTRRTGQRLSPRSGARVGWLTGLFSFVLFLFIFTVVELALNSSGMLELQKNAAMQDPNVKQALKSLSDPGAVIGAVVSMFLLLPTLPMLGGALAAKLSEKKT
jgi:hypothetical protein